MSDAAMPSRNAGDIRESLPALLNAEGPNWLEGRRWYADKGRAIVAIDIAALLLDDVDGDLLALTVLDVRFGDGDGARYLAPLAVVQRLDDDGAQPALGVVNGRAVVDATGLPWFSRWFLDAFINGGATSADAWQFGVEAAASVVLARARQQSGAIMAAEQSNTSLKYGDALIVKLIRRLQPGPNPDEEMLRALSAQRFSRVPAYVGAASWRSNEGVDFPIALAQAFVANDGDGWSWSLRRLEAIATDELDPRDDDFTAERRLGQRTAELHLALSQVDDPAFTPEMVDAESIALNRTRTLTALDSVIRLLQQRRSALPEGVRQRLPAISARLRQVAAWTAGYEDEAGASRIRVHGDYHLGQTLRTLDADWVIIDFEGEPARPVAERRQRASALKDVAGMLRSFSYARGAAERALDSRSSAAAVERLAAWERGSRAAFLEGYRGALPEQGALVPADDAAFARAVRAWEADKALYEIAYEIRNRPGWLELPLRALLPEADDQPAGDAVTAPA